MLLSLRPLGFGATLAGLPPRGTCAFVVGNLSFHGFPAICLTRWQFRSGLAEDVAAAVHKARKDKSRHALFCIAIDNLPQISATHGLAGTDTVVKTLASMLVKQFGSAPLARFNDSSFTALVSGMEPVMSLHPRAKSTSVLDSSAVALLPAITRICRMIL